MKPSRYLAVTVAKINKTIFFKHYFPSLKPNPNKKSGSGTVLLPTNANKDLERKRTYGFVFITLRKIMSST